MALRGAAVLRARRGQGHPGTPHCKHTVYRWCHKCPSSALAAPEAGIKRTGKTRAGKGEENKGLWTKEERSSGEEKARTQREEKEKQSSSSILCYLEEPKTPEPSLLQEHCGRIVAGFGNASVESQPLWLLSARSTCAWCLPVSLPPLSHFHLRLQIPGFALENPQVASMHPRGQLQTW